MVKGLAGQPRRGWAGTILGNSDPVASPMAADGLSVVCGATLQAARQHLAEADLVVLDIRLPDVSSFDLCRELRGSRTVPVIFLTSRANEVDRVVGLELAADDDVVKPLSPRELSARVRAILRRVSARQTTPLVKESLIINEERRTVTWHGVTHKVLAEEFRPDRRRRFYIT